MLVALSSQQFAELRRSEIFVERRHKENIFPSHDNIYYSVEIGMGGDQGEGDCLTLPKPLPVNLIFNEISHQREGLFIFYPVLAINMALLRRASWHYVFPTAWKAKFNVRAGRCVFVRFS